MLFARAHKATPPPFAPSRIVTLECSLKNSMAFVDAAVECSPLSSSLSPPKKKRMNKQNKNKESKKICEELDEEESRVAKE